MELDKLNTNRVAVLGATAMDMIVQVQEFPAPDGIVMTEQYLSVPGGSGGNVAEGIARLGYPVRFLGIVGDDENGKALLQAFHSSGVETKYIRVEQYGRTAACFIAINKCGERMIFSLGGTALYGKAEDVTPGWFTDVSILYIADAIPEVAVAAISKVNPGTKIVFCPGGLMTSLGITSIRPIMEHADIFILNRVEAEILTQESELEKAILHLTNPGPPVVIITLGNQGALLSENKKIFHVPAGTVQNVVDTTGAGDAFSVGILAGMMEKFDWIKTVQLGCEIASHKIQQLGSRTGLPKREMIAALKPMEN